MASALNQILLPAVTPQGPQYTEALSTEPVQTDSTILPTISNPTPAPEPPSAKTAQHPTPPLPSPAITAHDKGYVPRGFHRELIVNRWETIPDEQEAPGDVYGDAETFPEETATVQIVTFFMDGYVGQNLDIQARWESPLTSPLATRGALRKPQESKTWRWIHCEGLHGPTMKVIAEETDWSLDKFAGIFSWTRASSEWTDGCLRVHFQDQITKIWMLYKEQETNPVFITCTGLEPHPKLKKRWEDFIDFGDSRRELLLRKDPSLMLYCMMRAVIQDLRATAFTTPKDLNELYDTAMARPSKDSLSHFYGLQQRLIRVKLDTTSLRDAAASLIICVENVRKDATKRGATPLVSQDTHHRLQDQMGLVNLLFNELPEATRELDAVASLAFNILAFSNNNLLRFLAVLTIASVPLALACAILSIDFEGKILTGEKIATVLCSIGVAVILGVSAFLASGYIKLWMLRRQRAAAQKDKSLEDHLPIRERFADQQAQVQRILSQRSKRDSIRPDVYSPVLMPTIMEGASPPIFSLGTAFSLEPGSNNLNRRATVALGRRARQPGSPPLPSNTLV